eukprot:TRINITY_DN760_c0_g1_i8.p1 TRINITY_DN760_c0_g1~~TRINITY_DN760_c0_g1_i8.p1  ORF type:complete len:479 (+),score=38.87 TRINITY_DN760_c0_g1_i8:433-1869(+)
MLLASKSVFTCSVSMCTFYVSELIKKAKSFYVDLLLRCGDIHPNPGPSVAGMSDGFQKFKIISVNIRSINTSMGHLELMANSYEPEVFMIQESHLREGKETPHLEGYTVYRKDRTVAKKESGRIAGGGLLTYIRKDLNYKIIEIKQKANDPLEVSAVEIELEEKLIIYNVYRPPISSSDDVRERTLDLQCIDLKSNMDKNVIIMGDFNAHSSLWEKGASECRYGAQLSDWFSDKNLICWNEPDIPTRLSSRTSPDIALSNAGTNVESWSTLGTVNSDHSPMMVVLQSKCNNVDYRRFLKGGFNWFKADWPKYKEYLENACERISSEKINCKKIKMFKNEILKAKNMFIPRIYIRKDKAKRWWNSALIEKLRKFEEKQREVLDDDELCEENKKLLEELNNQICESVKECKEREMAKKVNERLEKNIDLAESGIQEYMNDIRRMDGRCTKIEIPFLHNEQMEKSVMMPRKLIFSLISSRA